MEKEIKTKEIKAIEKIYGEDVGDLVYLIQKIFNPKNESFSFVSHNGEALFIYYGDQDVKNSIIIFANEIKSIRFFSNEPPYNSIMSLNELIRILNENDN